MFKLRESFCFGWKTIIVKFDGTQCAKYTGYKADCFIMFGYIVYIGDITSHEEYEDLN